MMNQHTSVITPILSVFKNVTRLLNKNIDRRRVALNAYEVVLNRVDQNYETYLDEYAGSIERCIPPIE